MTPASQTPAAAFGRAPVRPRPGAAPCILVADDDRAIRTVIEKALARSGFEVRLFGTVRALLQAVETGAGDVAVLDVVMPDGNGLDTLETLAQRRPDLPVVVISAQNTLATAVKATERGAFDYLAKPFDINDVTAVIGRALEQGGAPVAGGPGGGDELPLLGRSSAMQALYRAMARLMATDLTVLITGESGTGKELVAQALHDLGKRQAGPFVPVNLAAIPKDLIESDLFGHEKGAFTGAVQRAQGRFAQAEGGTLFLDEIGDMPLDAQTRLLRVLQQGEYTRVGGAERCRTDVRVVAATNRDLTRLIRDGGFREDLFYRLNVVPLRVPPLRDRLEDIEELAEHFLARAVDDGLPRKRLDDGAVAALKRHRWPGNVRELENLMRRFAALYPQDVLGADVVAEELAEASPAVGTAETEDAEAMGLGDTVRTHLARYFASHGDGLPPPGLYARVLAEVEAPLIELALGATRGNQLRAAEILGLNRNTLRKKIRALDLSATDHRDG